MRVVMLETKKLFLDRRQETVLPRGEAFDLDASYARHLIDTGAAFAEQAPSPRVETGPSRRKPAGPRSRK